MKLTDKQQRMADAFAKRINEDGGRPPRHAIIDGVTVDLDMVDALRTRREADAKRRAEMHQRTAEHFEAMALFTGWCACATDGVRVQFDTYPATCCHCHHRIDPRK
jgi:hypothetical protein